MIGFNSLLMCYPCRSTPMTQQELLQTIEQAAAEGWEELDLSDQQLTELPPEIGKLTQLKVLKLGSKDDPLGYTVIVKK